MRRLLREQQPSSAKACAALRQWLFTHPALRIIAVYSQMPGEVDLSEIFLSHTDTKWVYPKVCGTELSFHCGLHLTPGAFGIPEPAPDSPEVPLTEIDAFICPGLAFDPCGGRLGRGRGFYDRMLAQARPDALKLGICFEIQLVPDTFSESHDARMDHVIFA